MLTTDLVCDLIAVAMSATICLAASYDSTGQVRETKREIELLKKRSARISVAIRRLGRLNLETKRALLKQDAYVADLERLNHDVETRIREVAASEALTLFNEPKQGATQPWRVILRCEDPEVRFDCATLPEHWSAQWTKGRHFLVHAVSGQRAAELVGTRFPEAEGFKVLWVTGEPRISDRDF